MLIPFHPKEPLRTLIIITGYLISVYLVYRLMSIILLIFIAFLFMCALNPYVNRLEKWKLPRGLSILVTYLVMVLVLGLSLLAIIPPFVTQVSMVVNQIKLPPILERNLSMYNLQDLQILVSQLTSVPKIVNGISSMFSVILYLVTFLAILYFILIERPKLHQYLVRLWGQKLSETGIEHFINTLEAQIGGWVRGQLATMIIFGLIVFIGLTLFGVGYALPLAILAALMELVPIIGGFISALPAIVLAYLTLSPIMGLLVMIFYILIQQIQHDFIVPVVMKQAVGLNPLITILIILIGLELFGTVGAILAIPLYLTVQVSLSEWQKIYPPKT